MRLSYWGFDRRAHTGAVVVNAAAVGDVVRVFRRLYVARFPIRRLRPIDAYRGVDERSMAADNTVRLQLPLRGRARAEALVGARVRPRDRRQPGREPVRARAAASTRRAGRAYLNRSRIRPGMAVRGGLLVDAFAAVGWQWGGRWTASPDYQHFSATGG